MPGTEMLPSQPSSCRAPSERGAAGWKRHRLYADGLVAAVPRARSCTRAWAELREWMMDGVRDFDCRPSSARRKVALERQARGVAGNWQEEQAELLHTQVGAFLNSIPFRHGRSLPNPGPGQPSERGRGEDRLSGPRYVLRKPLGQATLARRRLTRLLCSLCFCSKKASPRCKPHRPRCR